MGMWFTLIDFDEREFGLIRTDNQQKLAFQRFTSLASELRPSPSPTSTPKPRKNADFNGDGKVNSFDISSMFYRWSSKRVEDLKLFDLNEDGVINSFDFALLKNQF